MPWNVSKRKHSFLACEGRSSAQDTLSSSYTKLVQIISLQVTLLQWTANSHWRRNKDQSILLHTLGHYLERAVLLCPKFLLSGQIIPPANPCAEAAQCVSWCSLCWLPPLPLLPLSFAAVFADDCAGDALQIQASICGAVAGGGLAGTFEYLGSKSPSQAGGRGMLQKCAGVVLPLPVRVSQP